MPLHRRLKSYMGLDTTESKIRYLLSNYEFDTCSNIFEAN